MTFPRGSLPARSPSVPLSALMWVAALSLVSGCQPEQEEVPAEGLAQTSQKLRVANSLTTQALVLNAISTNPTASAYIINGGLATLFDPNNPSTTASYLRLQLNDPDAQKFMSYLVGCALPSGTSVAWKNAAGTTGTWEGILGLCPAWKLGVPSATCKNWVSSCLLARNNAFGRHVELSVRGEDPTRPGFFALAPAARPVEFDPDLNGTVPSFAPCTGSEENSASRNCGWKVDYVGQCISPQTVRLGAGGQASCGSAPLGSTSGARMMVRVCDDIVGCDSGSAHDVTQSDGTCGTDAPAVTFGCPASGFFSVMVAPYNPGLPTGTATVAVEPGGAVRYPAPEKDVFPMREGAYYGNLLDPNALALKVYVDQGGIHGKEQQVQGSVYKKMFSCQAPEWNASAAYAANRVCALPSSDGGPSSNCAATSVGKCIDPGNVSASRCRKEDGTQVVGDGDFEECVDNQGGTWFQPLTVYLHQACALLPNGGKTCDWRPVGR